MPQGYKKPPTPVSINQLSGTYKKGGKVRKYAEGGPADIADEKKRKAMEKAYEDSYKHSAELERAMNPLDMLKEGFEKAKGLFGKKPAGESVTKTKESVTVTPLKKRYGGAC
jgi:intein/homing endonuclease